MSHFLETGRLVLRAFTTADTDHLLALDNDPEVVRFINGGRPTSREAIGTRVLPRLLHDYPCWETAATGPRKTTPASCRRWL